MTTDTKTAKPGRPIRTLAEEIAAAETKLRALRERKKEEERREYERNQKAIVVLLRDEGLDLVAAERWRAVMPKLRQLLDGEVVAGALPKRVRKEGAKAEPAVAQPMQDGPSVALQPTVLAASDAAPVSA